MPTYRACGITATLTTCELKPSLSDFIDLRMGDQQKRDSCRIQKLLSNGEKLGERPIGLDGFEDGVVQFIGAHRDLPLYVVECSAQLRKKNVSIQNTSHKNEVEIPQDSDPPSISGASPTRTGDSSKKSSHELPTSRRKPKAESKIRTKSNTQTEAQRMRSAEQHTLEQVLQSADVLHAGGKQAMVLDVQMEDGSFLPSRSGSDLKIEVFINGQLADVSFVNARRSAVQIVGDKIRFAGTRVHRQTEKPWTYTPEDVLAHELDFEQRWHSIAAALGHEARQRGSDGYGNQQPSAEFLGALSIVQLPERLTTTSGVGLVDLVITAGKGQKYGPDTAYITCPTRLDDPDFTLTHSAIDPVLLAHHEPTDFLSGGPVASPFKAMSLTKTKPLESSPDVPISRMRRISVSLSPSPTKTAMNLAKEFGLDITREQGKVMTVGAFENARGKPGPEKRTLFQRLGDLKKMNERNQARELEKLKEEFNEVFAARDAARQAMAADRPAKRPRTNSDANYIDPSLTMMDPRIVQTHGEDDVFGAADPQAVLAQDRIDLALESGAASNGPLLRRIASTSPTKTPRRTRASALAYSPTRVPIKEQKFGGRKPQTPQKHPLGGPPPLGDGRTLPHTPAARGDSTSPTKSGRGSNRTATKWTPNEAPFTEALAAFEVPQACHGSCVTYPESKDAMRQIGKARGGSFKEETLVVGMRFVVW